MNKSKVIAGLLTGALMLTTASADIPYIAICGNVTVDGVSTEGVTIQAVLCDGATAPADWPDPAPSTTSGAFDASHNTNYELVWTSPSGDSSTPGPDGSFTFQSPINNAWFTAVDVALVVSVPDCPPVIVSCDTVRAAFDATAGSGDNIGLAKIDVNIDCPEFVEGTTATIGFWRNRNGQRLIRSLNGGRGATDLATWLSSNYPYCWGENAGRNDVTGGNNVTVAYLFQRLFRTRRGPKFEAQMLATALAVYVTDYDLAGDAAEKYDFIVSSSGTGALTHNVGDQGSRIGLSDDTDYTVYELLNQANLQKQLGTFDSNAFNDIFSHINEAYDRNGNEEAVVLPDANLRQLQ